MRRKTVFAVAIIFAFVCIWFVFVFVITIQYEDTEQRLNRLKHDVATRTSKAEILDDPFMERNVPLTVHYDGHTTYIISVGPDRKLDFAGDIDVRKMYDPTNGVNSQGDVIMSFD